MGEKEAALVSVREAATLLATTETRILMMLRQGKLVGSRVADTWMVERAALQTCRQPQAADVARPGGCGGGCGGCSGGH
ncbi:MAG: hypothetical protein A2091_04035 [Desulfuromonadales bacterium GWD2_61_12]|nr:MAG: hypothetical protein A2005_01580 [Desulfuromonadales bacterium GWC2_61_20]OGR34365.1 MAG: hypothetical protein A2091_04035 [Desulfuromonadales bacterium GWD2_61_12]HAD04008.1 hypothetical protein [Desulfuromonas sp.]HBT83163.1 hypothetical protein [Desulfuromonas sp.]